MAVSETAMKQMSASASSISSMLPCLSESSVSASILAASTSLAYTPAQWCLPVTSLLPKNQAILPVPIILKVMRYTFLELAT
jgi:hypothetical protein